MAVFSGSPSGVRRLVLPVLALGAAVPATGCVSMIAGPVAAVAVLPEVESRTGVLTPITEGRYDPLVRYPTRNVRYSLTIDEQDGSFILKEKDATDGPAPAPVAAAPVHAPPAPPAKPATATVPRPVTAPVSVAVAAVPPSPAHQTDVETPLLPAAAPAAGVPAAVVVATPMVAPPTPMVAPPAVTVAVAAASDVPPPVAPAPAAKAPVTITPQPAAPAAAPAPIVPPPQPVAAAPAPVAPAPAPAVAPAPRAVPVAPIVPDAAPAAPRSVVVTPCPSGGESWFRYTPEGYVCVAPTPAPAAVAAATAVAESARIPDRDCRTGHWVQATPGEFVCKPVGKGE